MSNPKFQVGDIITPTHFRSSFHTSEFGKVVSIDKLDDYYNISWPHSSIPIKITFYEIDHEYKLSPESELMHNFNKELDELLK